MGNLSLPSAPFYMCKSETYFEPSVTYVHECKELHVALLPTDTTAKCAVTCPADEDGQPLTHPPITSALTDGRTIHRSHNDDVPYWPTKLAEVQRASFALLYISRTDEGDSSSSSRLCSDFGVSGEVNGSDALSMFIDTMNIRCDKSAFIKQMYTSEELATGLHPIVSAGGTASPPKMLYAIHYPHKTPEGEHPCFNFMVHDVPSVHGLHLVYIPKNGHGIYAGCIACDAEIDMNGTPEL